MKRMFLAVFLVLFFFVGVGFASEDSILQAECDQILVAQMNQTLETLPPIKTKAEGKEIFDNGWFWSFVAGQFVNGASMNYAQSIGYYEEQDWWLGKHPSVARVWAQKLAETVIVYKIANNNKKYQDPFLIMCNIIVWYFVWDDFQDPRLTWKLKVW